VAESALIVQVPEAEPLVGRFRDQFDPMAVLGVPAHITVLCPFVPPERVTKDDVEQIGRIASATAGFRFRLVAARLFPDALYLEPEPSRPLKTARADLLR
jgi:2'-5' RNA ligase